MSTCAHRDDIASYVLGAMPEDELGAFRAHLATCDQCAAELAQLQPVADVLPVSVHPIAPPDALRGRLMAEVEREAALFDAAAGRDADAAAPRSERRSGRDRRERRAFGFRMPSLALSSNARGLALGGAVACAIAGAVVGTQITGDDPVPASTTVAAAVTDPSLTQAGAHLVIDADQGGGTLVVEGVPQPPSQRIYEVWLKRPGRSPEPTDALFTTNSRGNATVRVPGSLKGVQQVLVTHEPMGGSLVPTRRPIITAALT